MVLIQNIVCKTFYVKICLLIIKRKTKTGKT